MKVSRPWQLFWLLTALALMTFSALVSPMPVRAIMTLVAIGWALFAGGIVFAARSAGASGSADRRDESLVGDHDGNSVTNTED